MFVKQSRTYIREKCLCIVCVYCSGTSTWLVLIDQFFGPWPVKTMWFHQSTYTREGYNLKFSDHFSSLVTDNETSFKFYHLMWCSVFYNGAFVNMYASDTSRLIGIDRLWAQGSRLGVFPESWSTEKTAPNHDCQYESIVNVIWLLAGMWCRLYIHPGFCSVQLFLILTRCHSVSW